MENKEIMMGQQNSTQMQASQKLMADKELQSSATPQLQVNQQMQSNMNKGVPPGPAKSYELQPPTQQFPMTVQVIVSPGAQVSCPSCGSINVFSRRTMGRKFIIWCVCLFFFTGILFCWVPFLVDSCYDTEIVCARCEFLINSIRAPCC